MKRVIVDTGPIVALLSASDRHHKWTRAALDDVEAPMATCEPVLSEACFLLHRINVSVQESALFPRRAQASMVLFERINHGSHECTAAREMGGALEGQWADG